MRHKYFKTQGELIDHYTPFPPITIKTLVQSYLEEALIHAYELGAMHHSECMETEDNFELAEFDSNYEKETGNEPA